MKISRSKLGLYLKDANLHAGDRLPWGFMDTIGSTTWQKWQEAGWLAESVVTQYALDQLESGAAEPEPTRAPTAAEVPDTNQRIQEVLKNLKEVLVKQGVVVEVGTYGYTKCYDKQDDRAQVLIEIRKILSGNNYFDRQGQRRLSIQVGGRCGGTTSPEPKGGFNLDKIAYQIKRALAQKTAEIRKEDKTANIREESGALAKQIREEMDVVSPYGNVRVVESKRSGDVVRAEVALDLTPEQAKRLLVLVKELQEEGR